MSQRNELIKIALWHFYELFLVPSFFVFYFFFFENKVLYLRTYKFIRKAKTLFEWILDFFRNIKKGRKLTLLSYIHKNPKDIQWNLCDKNLLSRRGWNLNAKIFICALPNFILFFLFWNIEKFSSAIDSFVRFFCGCLWIIEQRWRKGNLQIKLKF